ncbi:DUF1049 domain-containing protein [Williamsia maris]|uniref:DUF1049 domain-containing protein n=1 Tax=Williamsia maris TaxID=72806 RepID=A0ABT1HGQ3_9NOCA|nr:DUF1049 domain-containing protein [Williamsia maris]MCP2177433.1 Protein of unknown function (DUF1049) [Williamsia maris]
MNTSTPTRRSGSFLSKITLVIGLVLIIALVVFVLQNTKHTTIEFISFDFDLGVGVALLGAAVVGAVIALIVSAAIRVRRAVK